MKLKKIIAAVVVAVLSLSLVQVSAVILAHDDSQFSLGSPGHKVDRLFLTESFTVTPGDIQDAILRNADKTVLLGSFSSHASEKGVPVLASSPDGRYAMIGTRDLHGQTVNYSVKVNGVSLPYGKETVLKSSNRFVQANDGRFKKEIYLTISAEQLKLAQAGTYKASLNLTTAA